MLKKKYRLLKRAKFERRLSFTTPFFVFKLAKNEEPLSRFGFIVSKNIDKKAVARNRIKRQTRFVIESNFDKIEKGYDMLFVARKEISGKTTAQISKEMLGELKKRKLLK